MTDDVAALFETTAETVADCLDADACGLFERQHSGELVLRAGTGWPEDAVGAAAAPEGPDSTLGRALRSPDAVVVADTGEEGEPAVQPPLPGAEVRSTVGAPVAPDGERWGVLELRAAAPRAFDEADAAFVADVADVLASALAADRRQSQAEEVYGRISDAFFALDEEWRFTYLNDRAHELINPGDEDLVGENVWEQFPEAVTREFKSKYEHAVDEQESVTFEEYYPEPLDAWFEVSAYPSETGLSVYFQDVTERKRVEQELRQSEARFRMLAEELEEVVWMTTADPTEFVYVNPAFGEVWGMDHETLYDQPLAFIDAIHPDDREQVREAYLALPEEPYDEEYRVVRPDGDVRWVHARGTSAVAPDADGEMVRVIGIGEDVTEHKRREERLEELVAELESSNERLEQFAYAASHDLQEPLRMVSSYLQLIEDRYGEELDEEAREFFDFAVDGADRMREMIQGLLAYSRVETGGNPFEPVALDAVLDAVEDDLRIRIEDSDAEIDADPLPTVVGDEGQLRQVFQNLLDNAIEYSGDDDPRIRIAATATDDSRWEITIRDEGIGIDPENVDRVFEVFERLHAVGDHAGTGIGLALVERIVERHGGEIRVDSKPGEGTAFTFSLPAAEPAD